MIKNERYKLPTAVMKEGISLHITDTERIPREYYENFMQIISITLMKQVSFLEKHVAKTDTGNRKSE